MNHDALASPRRGARKRQFDVYAHVANTSHNVVALNDIKNVLDDD
jgi:hypothetical protein